MNGGNILCVFDTQNMKLMMYNITMYHIFQDRANTEMKLLKELSEANDKNITFETKVDTKRNEHPCIWKRNNLVRNILPFISSRVCIRDKNILPAENILSSQIRPLSVNRKSEKK